MTATLFSSMPEVTSVPTHQSMSTYSFTFNYVILLHTLVTKPTKRYASYDTRHIRGYRNFGRKKALFSLTPSIDIVNLAFSAPYL